MAVVLQHIPCEPPGVFSGVLARHGIATETVELDEGGQLPDWRAADLIVAMGGIGFPGGAVYLNTASFTRGQRTKVSLAGPATNLGLGVVLLVILSVFDPTSANANLWAATAALAFLQLTATLLNILPVPGFDGYGAIEPYLSSETRAVAAKIAPFGFLAVFVLLFIPALNHAFFSVVYSVFDAFGIPSGAVAYGIGLFAFWL